tara:strand:+ start:3521 stop:4033 length:513 start_codon:yes stop_codon:yes gene_type:complete
MVEHDERTLDDLAKKGQAERIPRSDSEVIDVYPPGLLSDLETIKAEIDLQFAKLKRDPYQASQIVPEFKSTIIRLYALLIENDIPIQDPKRKRSIDEFITETLAEIGGVLGAKGAMGAIKAKKAFRDRFDEIQSSEDFEIYQDPETGDYYFIDPDTGEEVDCDEYGNPVE